MITQEGKHRQLQSVGHSTGQIILFLQQINGGMGGMGGKGGKGGQLQIRRVFGDLTIKYSNRCCLDPDSNKPNVKHDGDNQGNLNMDQLLYNSNKLLLILLSVIMVV